MHRAAPAIQPFNSTHGGGRHAVARWIARIAGTVTTAAHLVLAAPAIGAAVFGRRYAAGGRSLTLPWPWTIRLGVVCGNLRLQRVARRVLHRGMTVIDVGANVGVNTAVFASLVGPEGHVVAVEPADDNVRRLREHFQNSSVAVIPCAAAEARGTVALYARGGACSGINSLHAQSDDSASTTRVQTVQACAIDDIAPAHVDLVKMDVEGAEMRVLQGMARVLAISALTLIVEWHPALLAQNGSAPDALPRHLLAAGFGVTVLWHRWEEPLTADNIAPLTERLRARRRSVDLLARRPVAASAPADRHRTRYLRRPGR